MALWGDVRGVGLFLMGFVYVVLGGLRGGFGVLLGLVFCGSDWLSGFGIMIGVLGFAVIRLRVWGWGFPMVGFGRVAFCLGCFFRMA